MGPETPRDDATQLEGADAADEVTAVAATVLLLRDSRQGPEVLMFERPNRGAFASAWVFPGGKLDPEDRALDDEPEIDTARHAAVRETHEEVGLSIRPETLTPVSRWVPPLGMKPRIRTWFFAHEAPDAEIQPSADEVVWADWVRPAEVLERHGRGEITVFPPTWVTLHSLLRGGDVEGLLGAMRLTGLEVFESAPRVDGGRGMMWAGDAEYDGSGQADTARRHRLDTTGLPWVYTRTA